MGESTPQYDFVEEVLVSVLMHDETPSRNRAYLHALFVADLMILFNRNSSSFVSTHEYVSLTMSSETLPFVKLEFFVSMKPDHGIVIDHSEAGGKLFAASTRGSESL
jgi:hypothetical protein